jgi:hypothetical protein
MENLQFETKALHARGFQKVVTMHSLLLNVLKRILKSIQSIIRDWNHPVFIIWRKPSSIMLQARGLHQV